MPRHPLFPVLPSASAALARRAALALAAAALLVLSAPPARAAFPAALGLTPDSP